jgi:simple sugar transport system substrate-binding protein
MKRIEVLLTATMLAFLAPGAPAAMAADDLIGSGLTMYMQMGGNAGDGATLARQTGAAQAAKALGIELKEQFSTWSRLQPIRASS